jgi:hypothetical protein
MDDELRAGESDFRFEDPRTGMFDEECPPDDTKPTHLRRQRRLPSLHGQPRRGSHMMRGR